MSDLEFLISYLAEKLNMDVRIPENEAEQLRIFFKLSREYVSDPAEDELFLQVQDRVLNFIRNSRRTVSFTELPAVAKNMYLWKGDPTVLEVGALIDCTDENLMGCYMPCHICTQARIEAYAGVQLRSAFIRTMALLDNDVSAVITKAYNIPASFVIHPSDSITDGHYPDAPEEQLSVALQSRLHLAWMNNISSVALCCAFGYSADPRRVAEELVSAVCDWTGENPNYPLSIVFNVLTEDDRRIMTDVLSVLKL